MDKKIQRLQEIMSKALKLRRELDLIDFTTLAGEAADIYSLAKEELETKIMIANLEDGIEEENKKEALPDWAKVGEWGYDTAREEYFEIVAVTPFNVEVAYLDDEFTMVIGIPIFNADCVQARKRPFNAEEMKELIGKLYESSLRKFIITGYDKEKNAIKVNELWFTAEELMNGKNACNPPMVDGKPCYVLEHLENGEWVK